MPAKRGCVRTPRGWRVAGTLQPGLGCGRRIPNGESCWKRADLRGIEKYSSWPASFLFARIRIAVRNAEWEEKTPILPGAKSLTP